MLRTDLRLAARTLVRRPGFAVTAALTLALGIGATTLIFSVIDGVLLRPLPYADVDRVAIVSNTWVDYEQTWLSEPELLDYREAQSFEELAAFANTAVNLTGGDGPERVAAAAVTPNFFTVLGVDAEAGRPFAAEEGMPGRDGVVVLGHGLWQRRFGGDASIIGREIRVDGQARTVVGIMPAGFRTPVDFENARRSELYVPLVVTPETANSRGNHYLFAVGKVRPGVSVETASAELRAITDRLTEEGFYPPEIAFGAYAVPVRDQIFGSVRPALWVLLGAVGFVLLIACVNVANLLLARAEARQREFAVRAALGAGRRTILRQLLVEGLVLVGVGAAAGVALAYLGLDAVIALNPGDLPRLADIRIDGGVLAFTAATAVVSGILFSLAPAVHLLRSDVQGVLREGGRGATAGARRLLLQRTLVAAQVVLALVLLTGAGLMIQSFRQLLAIEPGFRAERVLTLRASPPAADYTDAGDVVAFYDGLLDRVRALPGVETAGATRYLPLSGRIGDWTIQIEGRQPAPGTDFDGDWQVVTPGYFEAMGITLVEGRFLDERDHADGAQVAVINERMARDYWPDESALGQRIRFGGDDAPWRTIVGVVGDVRHTDLTEEWRRTWYVTHAQFPVSAGTPVRDMTLTVHTAGDPTALIGPVREAVRALDPQLPIAQVRTVEDVVGTARAQPRFTAALLFGFAGLALTLAVIGIYGVMAYVVRQRTHDIGIRIALGAGTPAVLRHVMGHAAVPVGAGIAVGVLGAFALTRFMRDLLFDVAPTDAAIFAGVTALLAGAAALASYIPARRATRVDPIHVLRDE
ncbi:MAG: ABC transporter permease [Gemmatimonadota bacterium]